MPITIQDPCDKCGNEDPDNFRLYRAPEAYIGKYCKKCNTEWLKEDYLSRLSRTTSHVPDADFVRRRSEEIDTTDQVFINLDALYQNIPVQPKVNKAFQIQDARTKIDTGSFGEILKPGDHITWQRATAHWHHSIVSEVHGDKNEIVVIQWNKHKIGGKTQIFEENLVMDTSNADCLFNQMYRLDYPLDIDRMNTPELVLARAQSRVGDVGYGVLDDNCEAFSTFCKTGKAVSHQVIWLNEKITEGCGFSGAVLETGFIIYDLTKYYAARNDSAISRNVFVEASVRRIIEGIVSCGIQITCFFGAEIGLGIAIGTACGSIGCGPIGILVGIVVGGLVGGIVGGVAGKAIGTLGGSLVGKMIARCFPDDRAVLRLTDLKPEDHVVLNGWALHPRCHAIVVDYKLKRKRREKFVSTDHNGNELLVEDDEDDEYEDETEGELRVVRNTHNRGVVEEWMVFEKPLFKVLYTKSKSFSAGLVIANARAKIGNTKYNLARYNCKTFARECKTLVGDDGRDLLQLEATL